MAIFVNEGFRARFRSVPGDLLELLARESVSTHSTADTQATEQRTDVARVADTARATGRNMPCGVQPKRGWLVSQILTLDIVPEKGF